MNELSKRLDLIKPSATLTINAKATQLTAQGHKIINFSVGEPNIDTPPNVKAAAIEAIHSGITKYTPSKGTSELRNAISNKLLEENNLNYSPEDHIIVTSGAKQAIYVALQAMLNVGDEVIIPVPYWTSYPELVKINDGTPVLCQTQKEDGYKMKPDDLQALITPNTRCVILNSPNNPTGMVYSAAELEKLSEIILAHPRLYIISDDIYEHIIWSEEPFSNIVNVCPELKERTIVINGLSKGYSMTGWRVGYAAACSEIIKAMQKLISQSTTCVNSIAQVAATEALSGDTSFMLDMNRRYRERSELVYEEMSSISGVDIVPSEGTFYTFPCVQTIIDNLSIESDIALCELLLEHAGVATVPGSAFGQPGHIRLSFANSKSTLREGIEKIKQVFENSA
ncbi:MAG: aspartate aminotransferase [Legionellales bacterium]|nr:aspartate aminotransferase [Legionellales bacterium]|tara:strand:- start:376 stop:1566 length:1191 start_codon:yes stop_codon:yes gene_type:complete